MLKWTWILFVTFSGLSETQKQEKRQQHAIKETEFLRLKRSRLGVEDFEPLKGFFLITKDLSESLRILKNPKTIM